MDGYKIDGYLNLYTIKQIYALLLLCDENRYKDWKEPKAGQQC